MRQPLPHRAQSKAAPARASKSLVEEVDTWIFDLDNTLYDATSGLFDQIDQRMGAFIGRMMNVDADEARRIQKGYFMSHGTTLRGLMEDHGVDPGEFLAYVHDIDLTGIEPDFRLRDAVDRLSGRCLIFTNGDTAYAGRVLERLGLAEAMDGIFDIADAGYRPKPAPETYDIFIRQFDIAPERTAMVDDMARNLSPAARMGMRTIWLKTHLPWGAVDIDEAHIDHIIDDLGAWLSGLTAPEDRA